MKKEIVIKEANKEKIDIAINEAEGRATARTIGYLSIVLAIDEIERRLGIKKKAMTGITAEIDDHAQVFPAAYKYTPYSTHAYIEKTATGWKLTDITREPTGRKKITLNLTDEAKKAIIERMEQF